MEVDKIIPCNLIFKDGSKMEIKPENGVVLEREDYCANCGETYSLTILDLLSLLWKRKNCDTEFTITIPEEAAKRIGEMENKK